MKIVFKLSLVVLLALLMPTRIFACTACYNGDASSPLTDGMNWGIFTLLGVVITVLASILIFFVHIIRKSEAMAAQAEKCPQPVKV